MNDDEALKRIFNLHPYAREEKQEFTLEIAGARIAKIIALYELRLKLNEWNRIERINRLNGQ